MYPMQWHGCWNPLILLAMPKTGRLHRPENKQNILWGKKHVVFPFIHTHVLSVKATILTATPFRCNCVRHTVKIRIRGWLLGGVQIWIEAVGLSNSWQCPHPSWFLWNTGKWQSGSSSWGTLGAGPKRRSLPSPKGSKGDKETPSLLPTPIWHFTSFDLPENGKLWLKKSYGGEDGEGSFGGKGNGYTWPLTCISNKFIPSYLLDRWSRDEENEILM